MIQIKKKLFFIIKAVLVIVALLTLILFFYSAFFYTPSSIDTKTVENQIKKEEEKQRLEQEKLRLEEEEIQKKINSADQEKNKIEQIKTTIKDGIFVTVDNRAITKSDVVDEIKKILILNNMSYSDERRDELQKIAIKSIIKKNIKEIEINKHNFLEFKQDDLNNELNLLASRLNMDIDTLKKICISNGLDFLTIEDQIKTELLWNSLIFYLYGNRISINLGDIDEQLKLNQNKKQFKKYLISEIILRPVEKDKLVSRVKEIKNKIKIEGFETVAMNLSISQTAAKGGDLGWLNENEISKKFRSQITDTPIGSLSEPILINEGILIFKVRDKRIQKEEINLEELKNRLVRSEKMKILNMYSMSHYDNLRRSILVKFIDE